MCRLSIIIIVIITIIVINHDCGLCLQNVQVVSTITPAGKRITHSCEVRNTTLLMNGIPSDTHTQTASTVSSESQPVETTPPSDETNHTNGNTASSSLVPKPPNDAVVCSPAASEQQDVDSTRHYANASVSKPAMDTSERTSSSDDSLPVKDIKETSEHNEAEACKMMEVESRTGVVDSDDSDGNKGAL